MKKKIISTMIGITFCFTAYANILDIYGADPKLSKDIINKYGKEVSAIEKIFLENLFIKAPTEVNKNKFQKIVETRSRLMEKIKKEYHLLYVDFQTVFYGKGKEAYSTIEVISTTQPERLKYVSAIPVNRGNAPKKDLIQSMKEYQELSAQSFFKGTLKMESCPVYHCVGGFDAPELKPYLALFNEGVIKEKQLILNTLKTDPDSDRREAAEFLVGHFKDPNEIIQILTPYIQDPYSGIRNNAMRIIGMTMDKAKIYQINLIPIIERLDAPSFSDRNKALGILEVALKAPENHKIILEKSGDTLVKILALKQPNNHNTAYSILKLLSKKDFGEHNIAAWTNWLHQAQKKLA